MTALSELLRIAAALGMTVVDSDFNRRPQRIGPEFVVWVNRRGTVAAAEWHLAKEIALVELWQARRLTATGRRERAEQLLSQVRRVFS